MSLSYKEKKNTFDKDTLSFNYPTSLSYKDNRENYDEGKMSFKQPVKLSYNESKTSFNESFKQIASKVIRCSYNDKAYNKNASDKDFSYIYPSKLSFYEEKKEKDI